MSTKKFNLSSILFSLNGFFSILLIWAAGSPQYGVFSQISYHVGGFEVLLLVGILMLGISALLFYLSPTEHMEEKIIPLLVLIVSTIPLFLFGVVLLVRVLLGET